MAVIVNLDPILEKRKMGITELSNKVGIAPAALTALNNNHADAIRFSTLDILCKALQCTPGDILEFIDEE